MGASNMKLRDLISNVAGNTRITVHGEYTGTLFFDGRVVELIGSEETFGVENSYAEHISIRNGNLIVGIVTENEF